MWPHVCFRLLISKCLAFSGMKTNRVTFLRYAVPLDFSLFFWRDTRSLKEKIAPDAMWRDYSNDIKLSFLIA